MLNSVADFAGVSLSSACRIISDISAAIARLYSKYIVLHTTTTDKFYNIAQFPRVCGAIDCTHVRIQSPCKYSMICCQITTYNFCSVSVDNYFIFVYMSYNN